MLWLYNNSKKRRLHVVVTDILGALQSKGRAGRPTVQTDNNMSPRINRRRQPDEPELGAMQIFITDNANWPAGNGNGIDSPLRHAPRDF